MQLDSKLAITITEDTAIIPLAAIIYLLLTLLKRTMQKMLMRRVLSDRHKTTQEEFQYNGVELCMMFRAYTLYHILLCYYKSTNTANTLSFYCIVQLD